MKELITLRKSFDDRRDLRLPRYQSAAPSFELEPLGHGRKRREEHIEYYDPTRPE
jgi:hypothetical protein